MNNNQENIMKKLEEYRKEPGFTVPDGYYDDLYEKMMGRIAVEHHKTKNQNKVFRFSMFGTAAAAAVALLVTVTILNQNEPTNYVSDIVKTAPKIEQSTISNSEITVAQIPNEVSETKSVNTENVGNGASKTTKISNSTSTNSDNSIDLEDPVLEFYAEDTRSDQFQEALMDLECYYEF
jgi:hypothetical protein